MLLPVGLPQAGASVTLVTHYNFTKVNENIIKDLTSFMLSIYLPFVNKLYWDTSKMLTPAVGSSSL